MDDRTESSDDVDGSSEARPDDQLRTISFRLREIQRLVGMRVEQENRRLEADGIEPVTDHAFFKPGEEDGDADTQQ